MMSTRTVGIVHCGRCGRTFSKPEHLKRHERSHTGERPFACPVCGKRYARRDVLTRHIRGHPRHLGRSERATPQVSIQNGTISSDANSVGRSHELHDDVDLDPSTGHGLEPADIPETGAISARTQPLVQTPEMRRQSTIDIANPPEFSLEDILQGYPRSESAIDGVSGGLDAPISPTSRPMPLPNSFDILAQVSQLDLGMLEEVLLLRDSPGSSASNERSVSGITSERLDLIKRLWPRWSEDSQPFVRKISPDELLRHPRDNIFSLDGVDQVPVAYSPPQEMDSAWRFTEHCWPRLLEHYNAGVNRTHMISGSDPGTASSEPAGSALPSAEILDLSLDLYFFHFQHCFPVVHPSTFNAAETPSNLLFPMCLIGLVIFDRNLALLLGRQYLSGAVYQSRIEIMSLRRRHCTAPEAMTALASASLLQFLVLFMPDVTLEEQRASLHAEMISLALQKGLLGSSGWMNPSASTLGYDSDAWKAWARVESANRLTGSMILSDAYFAHTRNTTPHLHQSQLLVPMMGGDITYLQSSYSDWLASDISTARLGGFRLQVTLGCLWIRILHARHRLVQAPGTADVDVDKPFPGSLYDAFRTDSEAKNLGPELVASYAQNADEYRFGNTNSLIIWNFLGLILTSNLPLIEQAAGRCGSASANSALPLLASWARTPTARRACLHAAQIFVIISAQRRSDGMTIYAELALFSAALVLGLYLATVPQSLEEQENRPCLDLLAEIDWTSVGAAGLDPDEHRGHTEQGPSVDLASRIVKFIKEGGPVSFWDTRFRSSTGVSRRLFMNFSARLEETGKWTAREYYQVLQVLADMRPEP